MAVFHISLGKLIRVERSINVYSKRHRQIVKKIAVDHIPFEQLKEVVPPEKDDPQLYDGYMLNKSQMKRFNSYLAETILFDGRTHYCVLECYGIYEK